ncbi:Ent-kaurene synthase [Melanomma pulvis-pyrius CBS 109.77]|uniref:Ent-kaurene synthase n=1 Tax=Melanomma pulvis-pyrius CBS 109.77 TaxID=1314802 RepID=A0A6A6XWK6_9PLEO|nr:Ent-kaurene synthase [Melanomma pulvis-pyrius CBS 109.77]
MDRKQVEQKAEELVQHVAKGCISRYEGSWTLSVYDTAWVSMIEKPDGNWLFPESFKYILQRQIGESGWVSHASEIDGILNTLAALLTIEKHLCKENSLSDLEKSDLQHRKVHGLTFLQNALEHWDVGSCMHVGFEILVPALLSMLEAYGIKLQFPSRPALDAVSFQKSRLFKAEMLYGPYQSTTLHSLEAFIGKVDFLRLRHHKVNGSMLGSPSSTAAYLMNISEWDQDAEDYLRDAIQHGGGFGLGGVPSAYPCEIFEFTWVLTTLVQAGLPSRSFQNEAVSRALSTIASQLRKNKGAVGFASGMLPDADDTAKAIHILNALGQPTSPKQMVSSFMSPKGHIMTYMGERNLSPSANCNALICILDSPDMGELWADVEKITNSLCDCWWENKMVDKWNLSINYSAMLLAQAFTRLVQRWDFASLRMLPDTLIRDRVVVVLVQLLNRVLFGSSLLSKDAARSYPESVAYEVLTCSALRSLPLSRTILSQLDSVIEDGRDHLTTVESTWETNQYLWIEKITYGSQTLSKAYCLAALYAKTDDSAWSDEIADLFQPAPDTSRKLTKFFQMVHVPEEPAWKYETCVLEGATFAAKLRSCRTAIFPSRDGFKDKYLTYIPATWTLVNNFRGLNLSTKLLWEMMKFSMLDFLVDEYMETSVTLLNISERALVKECISKDLLPRVSETSVPWETNISKIVAQDESNLSERIGAVCTVLAKYVKEVMRHPSVRAASQYDRTQLRIELHDFLIAHIIQMEDNTQLYQSQKDGNPDMEIPIFSSARSSFYNWARTTAAQHISCPVSFAFYSCLLNSSSDIKHPNDCFLTPEQKYKASDFCAHLAVMSRLFNDYASIRRDQQERNLNSVNFPEFHPSSSPAKLTPDAFNTNLPLFKNSLLQLGEYERRASRAAMANLVDEIHSRDQGRSGVKQETTSKGIELFAYVTELFADIYVAKDLTNAAQ